MNPARAPRRRRGPEGNESHGRWGKKGVTRVIGPAWPPGPGRRLHRWRTQLPRRADCKTVPDGERLHIRRQLVELERFGRQRPRGG